MEKLGSSGKKLDKKIAEIYSQVKLEEIETEELMIKREALLKNTKPSKSAVSDYSILRSLRAVLKRKELETLHCHDTKHPEHKEEITKDTLKKWHLPKK